MHILELFFEHVVFKMCHNRHIIIIFHYNDDAFDMKRRDLHN